MLDSGFADDLSKFCSPIIRSESKIYRLGPVQSSVERITGAEFLQPPHYDGGAELRVYAVVGVQIRFALGLATQRSLVRPRT